MKRIFSFLLLLCACSLLLSLKRSDQGVNYVKIADKIVAKTANTLCKKHQLSCIADSAGMMHCVYMVGMSFEIRCTLDENEARIILIDCVEELLEAINSNKEIRPFLSNYPFNEKNIHLAIFSVDKNGQDTFDPYIGSVSISKQDSITFRTKDPNNIYGYKNEYRENYQEALKTVRKQILEKDM